MGLFSRRPPRRDPMDWRSYESPEAFAFALCMAGTPADEARAMLRAALIENRQIAEELRAEAERRARDAELSQRTMDSAFLAASKLLSEVGYQSGRWA